MSSTAFTTPFLPTTRRALPTRRRNQTAAKPLAASPWYLRVVTRATAAPSLPAAASPDDREARQQELDKNRKLYVYKSPPTIPGIAFVQGPVDALPGQMPRFSWVIRAGISSIKVLLNFLPFNPFAIFTIISFILRILFSNKQRQATFDNLIAEYAKQTDSRPIAESVMKRFGKARTEGSQFEEKNPALEPYRDMWNVLQYPPIANIFLEDSVFCRLRVAGYNPISLFRVRAVDDLPFTVPDSALPNPGDSLSDAVAENRLYAIDHSFVSGLQQKVNNPSMVVVPTKALFAVPPGGGKLQPVAIQVANDIVYPPKPGARPETRWAIAKMALNNDDAIHHELVAHLGRCHLLVEPFVLATMRQLPSAHPLHMLLKPHMEGTVFINDTASKSLVAPGGDVDRVFGGEIGSVMAWCADEVVNNKFNAAMPDVEMEARGIMDPILQMPYREDALEHFAAMYEWVYDYLANYYKSDTDVLRDGELQLWVAELVDPARGRLKDFGDNGDGKVVTLKYLARAVTFVIFSGSVQHAAVNFPQFSYMAYAPAVAGSLWAMPPRPDETADLDRWEETLTPIKTAIEQVQILGVIGTVYHTKLADYRSGEIPDDPVVQDALQRYKEKLAKIDARIKKREEAERLPYDYMRPSSIPQSVNI